MTVEEVKSLFLEQHKRYDPQSLVNYNVVHVYGDLYHISFELKESRFYVFGVYSLKKDFLDNYFFTPYQKNPVAVMLPLS